MSALSTVMRQHPFQTLHAMAAQSVPAALANLTVVNVDLQAWARDVCRDPTTVLPQVVQIPGWKGTATKYTLLGPGARCEKTKTYSYENIAFLDPEELETKTFAVVLANVREGRLVPPGEGNHVVQVYLHRDHAGDAPWKAVVCDPNFSEAGALADEQRRGLLLLGYYALKYVAWPPQEPRPGAVELQRCVNVNRCIRKVGGGICFTGLCATLVAASAYSLQKKVKAAHGTDLMHLVVQASESVRSEASWLVALMHLGVTPATLARRLRLKE
jgi:hypothetical protein